MRVKRLELRFTSADGARESSCGEFDAYESGLSVARDGVELNSQFTSRNGRPVIRTAIRNNRTDPISLEAIVFEIETGLPADRPARFFKHGYQSWSASGAVDVGLRGHRLDNANSIIRLSHQSEAVRPPEAPESATSELFTIITSSDVSDSVLVGFIEGASELTTVTVTRPDLAIARALLDGVHLAPGDEREIAPLTIESYRSSADLVANWASLFGANMNARIAAPYQRGWCSWYHYFHDISEDAMLANIKALGAMRTDIPLELIQLDDGFQSALGDWDTSNAKFPSGLKRIADEIRGAGFAAGIWTAPFLAARDSRLMREHPQWLLLHENGEPLRAGYNTRWTTDPEGFAYALDPSNPEFRAHLEELFSRMVKGFGYSYLKLDFLFAGAAEGKRFDPDLTRAEMLRAGLDAIRAGAGDDSFILGCGCPLGPAVGIVDGMRIGPDVAPYWGASASDPSTVHALDAIIARSFMHRRLWLNDPDCLMLRARDTKLNAEERGALAATIAASGGMLLISDDMALVDDEAATVYRNAARIGAAVDSQAARETVYALDLMSSADVRGIVQAEFRSTVESNEKTAMLLNRGDQRARVKIPELGLGTGTASVMGLAGVESPLEDELEMPPHSARFVRIKPPRVP
jgi:alpha-galactosidase